MFFLRAELPAASRASIPFSLNSHRDLLPQCPHFLTILLPFSANACFHQRAASHLHGCIMISSKPGQRECLHAYRHVALGHQASLDPLFSTSTIAVYAPYTGWMACKSYQLKENLCSTMNGNVAEPTKSQHGHCRVQPLIFTFQSNILRLSVRD